MIRSQSGQVQRFGIKVITVPGAESAAHHMEKMFETDEELILACRKGDTHAWECLLHKYERLVFSIALNYGLSRDDAADVVQTTFLGLIQNLDTLRADSRLSAWLA